MTDSKCKYCADKSNNLPIVDSGACKAELQYDGFDWVLNVAARQEDRWYGDITDDSEIYFCPMCGRSLR